MLQPKDQPIVDSFVYCCLPGFNLIFARFLSPGIGNLLFSIFAAAQKVNFDYRKVYIPSTRLIKLSDITCLFKTDRPKRSTSILFQSGMSTFRLIFIFLFRRKRLLSVRPSCQKVLYEANPRYSPSFYSFFCSIAVPPDSLDNLLEYVDNCLVIHIRLGDTVGLDVNTMTSYTDSKYFNSAYARALSIHPFLSRKPALICTDGSPEQIQKLKLAFDYNIVDLASPVAVIHFLSRSNFLVTSNSSLSLWAAYFSSHSILRIFPQKQNVIKWQNDQTDIFL